MLEDLKPILNDLGEKLDQMRISLEIPAKEEKIAELEYKMSEPSFWDDAAAAQKLNQELAALKGGIFMLALQGRDFISRAGEKLRAAMRMAMGLPRIHLPRNVF